MPLTWPSSVDERRKVIDTWHSVAMRTLNKQRYSFRLAAVIPRFINWKEGSLWPSNKTLAEYAGGCSEDTISTDIGAYVKLGLLQIKERKVPGSNFRQRILWPSLPVSVTDTVSAPVTDTVSVITHPLATGPKA